MPWINKMEVAVTVVIPLVVLVAVVTTTTIYTPCQLAVPATCPAVYTFIKAPSEGVARIVVLRGRHHRERTGAINSLQSTLKFAEHATLRYIKTDVYAIETRKMWYLSFVQGVNAE